MEEGLFLPIELVEGPLDQLLSYSSKSIQMLVDPRESRCLVLRIFFLHTLYFCQPDQLMSEACGFTGILKQEMKYYFASGKS